MSDFNFVVVALWSLLVIVIQGAPIGDLVNMTLIPQLPQNYTHKWYSGYLTASKGDSIYYSFLESQNNASTDPIILWLQGGPGCSSLFGMYYENGPFKFKASSTESYINEFAWNMNASVLYIESPPGVGFSQSNFSEASDKSTTKASLAALVDFFHVKFPEYAANDFYLSGESYAGIYIPNLATAILVHNVKYDQNINLKGFILGNGCTLGAECTEADSIPEGFSTFEFQQFKDHAFIGEEVWEQYQELCLEEGDNFDSKHCRKVQKQILKNINFDYVDVNNINGKCYHAPPQYEAYAVQRSNTYRTKLFEKKTIMSHMKHDKRPGLCDYEVGDFYLLNNDTVRQALHINITVAEYFWQTCTNNSFVYNARAEGSFDLYPLLLKSGLRIWIYSGDVDANVPITGTLEWIYMLQKRGLLKGKNSWRSWFIPGDMTGELQVGGMVWNLNRLTFVSIREAGHEVPFWQPERAFVMIQNFLTNTEMPTNPDKSLIANIKHFQHHD